MKEEINIQRKLKNAKGKRLLESTILEYSKEIISAIQKDYSLLDEITENLQIPEEELFKILSGEKKGNIIYYDQALSTVKKRKKAKNNKREYRERYWLRLIS